MHTNWTYFTDEKSLEKMLPFSNSHCRHVIMNANNYNNYKNQHLHDKVVFLPSTVVTIVDWLQSWQHLALYRRFWELKMGASISRANPPVWRSISINASNQCFDTFKNKVKEMKNKIAKRNKTSQAAHWLKNWGKTVEIFGFFQSWNRNIWHRFRGQMLQNIQCLVSFIIQWFNEHFCNTLVLCCWYHPGLVS